MNDTIRPFPSRMRHNGGLWANPIVPALYGMEVAAQDVVLLPNCASDVLIFLGAHADEATVLAWQAGGHSIRASAAFGLKPDLASSRMESLGLNAATIGALWVPVSTAVSLGLKNDQHALNRTIKICQDDLTAPLAALTMEEIAPFTMSPIGISLYGIWSAVKLALGQFVLFAIPLYLFGLRPLVLGGASLFVGAGLIGGVWGHTSLSGWLMGLISGLVMAIGWGLAGFLWGQGVAWNEISGILLIGLWQGIVVSGAKQ